MIAWLLFLHFLSDFLLQTREMALKKSAQPLVLFAHVHIIFLTFFLGTTPFIGATKALLASALNSATHAVIDWNIWRGYKYLRRRQPPDFKYWEDSLFYTTIGLDQLLHVWCLVLSFWVMR